MIYKITGGTIYTLFKMPTKDGEMPKIQMRDTKGILTIIQSILSPKAEPIKRWPARVGSERMEEINNPKLAMDMMKEIYEKKNYSNY